MMLMRTLVLDVWPHQAARRGPEEGYREGWWFRRYLPVRSPPIIRPTLSLRHPKSRSRTQVCWVQLVRQAECGIGRRPIEEIGPRSVQIGELNPIRIVHPWLEGGAINSLSVEQAKLGRRIWKPRLPLSYTPPCPPRQANDVILLFHQIFPCYHHHRQKFTQPEFTQPANMIIESLRPSAMRSSARCTRLPRPSIPPLMTPLS